MVFEEDGGGGLLGELLRTLGEGCGKVVMEDVGRYALQKYYTTRLVRKIGLVGCYNSPFGTSSRRGPCSATSIDPNMKKLRCLLRP